MKQFILFLLLILCSSGLFAVPLESGYSLAPIASASSQEKANAFMEARILVIDAAEKYLDTPYRHGGLNRSGLDCSGLVYLSFRDALGVSPPRSTTALYSWVEKIPADKAQLGDLVFFKTDNSAAVTHVGIYMGSGRFIHAASSGSSTGVIYSNLSEQYWAGTFVAAGRAFPEAPPGAFKQASTNSSSGASASANASTQPGAQSETSSSSQGKNAEKSGTSGEASRGWLLFGVAFAPSYNLFLEEGPFVRGYTSQIRLAVAFNFFSTRLVIGLEMRPEFDIALDVFRLPFTLSLGIDDKYTIFAGPVFSPEDPEDPSPPYLKKIDREYAGGTSWMGAAGITAAPFIIKTKIGEFAPYAELAWQYYIPKDTSEENVKADILAASRFSTGLRWTIPLN